MSKLPMLSARQIMRVLERRGFVLVRQTGSHARFVHSTDHTRYATVAMHVGDISKKDLASILRQSKITREEFLSLL